MPMKPNEREYRDFTLAVVELEAPDQEEKKIVRGYASTFNEPYTLYEDGDVVIQEQVAPTAFDSADMSDVIMQFDHRGKVFARISNNTLTVRADDHGLAIEADLGGTEIGRQLYEEIRGGYITKMSYGYTVPDDGAVWEERKLEDGRSLEIRTVVRVSKVYDVSAVSLPANDGTSISVRNLSDGVIEQIKAERLHALELKRKKLQTRMRLGGINNV